MNNTLNFFKLARTTIFWSNNKGQTAISELDTDYIINAMIFIQNKIDNVGNIENRIPKRFLKSAEKIGEYDLIDWLDLFQQELEYRNEQINITENYEINLLVKEKQKQLKVEKILSTATLDEDENDKTI